MNGTWQFTDEHVAQLLQTRSELGWCRTRGLRVRMIDVVCTTVTVQPRAVGREIPRFVMTDNTARTAPVTALRPARAERCSLQRRETSHLH